MISGALEFLIFAHTSILCNVSLLGSSSLCLLLSVTFWSTKYKVGHWKSNGGQHIFVWVVQQREKHKSKQKKKGAILLACPSSSRKKKGRKEPAEKREATYSHDPRTPTLSQPFIIIIIHEVPCFFLFFNLETFFIFFIFSFHFLFIFFLVSKHKNET